MTIPSDITVFLTNPEIKPSFLEDTIVVLTRDYIKVDPLANKYLEKRRKKKDAVGRVIACGQSRYGFSDETEGFSGLVDNSEWSLVEVGATVPDFNHLEGWVKAEDLRLLSAKDVGLD